MDVVDPNTFLFSTLDKFFAINDNKKIMTRVLYNEVISLRILDWFVSNYSKKNNVVYTTEDGRMFNVFMEYKAQLKSYGKKWFDPFCRGGRFDYEDCDGIMFSTTVGQLNFFRWALKNEIIKYCIQNLDVIEEDMANTMKNRKNSVFQKRRELSKAVIKKCVNISTKITIHFD